MAAKKQLKNYHLFFKGCLGITVKNFKKFSPLMSLCYFFFIHWTTPYNNLHWLTSFFTGLKIKAKLKSYFWTSNKQRAKKVVSHSVGLVDFAIGLKWILFLTCLMGKWNFFRNSNDRRTQVINPAHKIFFRLVEMTFGLVHASYSLPEWQAVKLTFFSPWIRSLLLSSHPLFTTSLN